MASPTQWTWVWVNSRSWWWTGKPGMLQSMGSQRVGHDWVTELNWTDSLICYHLLSVHSLLCDSYHIFSYFVQSTDKFSQVIKNHVAKIVEVFFFFAYWNLATKLCRPIWSPENWLYHLRRKQQRGPSRTGLGGRLKVKFCAREIWDFISECIKKNHDSRLEVLTLERGAKIIATEEFQLRGGVATAMRDHWLLGSGETKLGAVVFGKGGNGESGLQSKRGAMTHLVSRELWEKQLPYEKLFGEAASSGETRILVRLKLWKRMLVYEF